MRVQAKHGVFYNGSYYSGGEVFEADDCDRDVLEKVVNIVVPPSAKPAEETPKRNAGKRSAKTTKNKL